MIKKTGFFSAVLAILTLSLSGAWTDLQNAKDRIVEASDTLFNAPASQDILIDSLIQLLDVALALTSESPYKEEIIHHVNIAKDLIKNDSFFNEKARQYISFAYRMVTQGKKYQRPEELDKFVTPAEAQEKAMKYAKGLIQKSLSELDAGREDRAAKPLLELVLMVITPISG
jgi:hypothetical protein